MVSAQPTAVLLFVNVFNAVKSGFSNVKEHITGLASQAFNWGKDLIMGIVNGIKSCISAVGDAVSSVAEKIKSFLHLPVPDEGPLKRYVQPDDKATDRDLLIKLIGKNAYENDWNHTSVQAGLNAWIGKLADGSAAAVQTMPWDYRSWGCGSGSKGSCNDGWIQFEICEDGLNDKDYFELWIRRRWWT